MGRMAVQPPVPQHRQPHGWRVIGRFADLQGMMTHELLRDAAAHRRHQVGLAAAER